MVKNILFISGLIVLSFCASAADTSIVYDFVTYCPQSHQACGVVLDQVATASEDSPDYRATMWKGDRARTKTVSISKSKFRHIDGTFQNMHLWVQMQEGAYTIPNLPKDDRMLFLNVKSANGQHHLIISRYSKNLTPLEKVVLNWEAFLKGQVMKVNTSEFKQEFPKP